MIYLLLGVILLYGGYFINWLITKQKRKKQREQKPAWSEEDENLLNHSLENLTELKNRFGEKYGKVGECIYWLKLLKQRMKGK